MTGPIRNCSSAATVTGKMDVGGLVGFTGNYGSVTTCCSASEVTGEMNVGGLAGFNTFYSVEDVWWIPEGKDYPRLFWELSEDR